VPNNLCASPIVVVKARELRAQQVQKAINQQLSRELGQMIECCCCLEDVTFEDVTNCEDGHLCCQDCAKRATQALLDSGKTNLKCLYPGCTYGFAPSEMRRFLDNRTYEFYQRRVQAEELLAVCWQFSRSASQDLQALTMALLWQVGINNLVACPFCDFACINENDQDRVFRCLNPKCMKESCRLCKEENHVPLRCDEVEKKLEVRVQVRFACGWCAIVTWCVCLLQRDMRVFVTEQMTEALIRECPKCHTRFFKEEGCNHMVWYVASLRRCVLLAPSSNRLVFLVLVEFVCCLIGRP
jgi:E3 ubiquitin-protein ligase RNF216